jgi:hypothetical protein
VLLSESFNGTEKIHHYRCDAGHEWSAPALLGKLGDWCRQCCHQTRSLSLDVARRHAQQKGGKCLATHYRNSIEKMSWQCREGHIWEQSLSLIRAGEWCRICRKTEREAQFKLLEDKVPAVDTGDQPIKPGRRSTSKTNLRRRGRKS